MKKRPPLPQLKSYRLHEFKVIQTEAGYIAWYEDDMKTTALGNTPIHAIYRVSSELLRKEMQKGQDHD